MAAAHWGADAAVRIGSLAYQARNTDEGGPESALARLPRADHRRAPFSSVLPVDDYQLLLVESPNVPDTELRSALRWRIKDLVDFPVDDAVVEAFEMPSQANRGQKPMVYVVVAPGTRIQQHLKLVAEAGIDPDVIDIPELCIRNLAVQLPQDADGVGFLYFAADYGILTVTRQRVLFVIRRLEIGRRDFETAQGDELIMGDLHAQVSLQLKRSLDYYESHYGNNPIGNLVLAPAPELVQIGEFLQQELALRVDLLDLSELFQIDAASEPDEQSQCLLAIGATLRTLAEAA